MNVIYELHMNTSWYKQRSATKHIVGRNVRALN
jgi:hypothetical protein